MVQKPVSLTLVKFAAGSAETTHTSIEQALDNLKSECAKHGMDFDLVMATYQAIDAMYRPLAAQGKNLALSKSQLAVLHPLHAVNVAINIAEKNLGRLSRTPAGRTKSVVASMVQNLIAYDVTLANTLQQDILQRYAQRLQKDPQATERVAIATKIFERTFEIAHIAADLTRIPVPEDAGEDFYKSMVSMMLLAGQERFRALFIKIEDQIVRTTMQSLHEHTPAGRKLLTDLSERIYAVAADAIGYADGKRILEDRVFEINYPKDYAALKAEVLKVCGHDIYAPEFIQQREVAQRRIAAMIREETGLDCVSEGRTKGLASLWRKAQADAAEKGISWQQALREINDIVALRVIQPEGSGEADSKKIVTLFADRKWVRKFKDYLNKSSPRGLAYRALHTILSGEKLIPGFSGNIELQVRTHAEHMKAECGVAAHLVAKDGLSAKEIDNIVKLRLRAMRRVTGVDVESQSPDVVMFSNGDQQIRTVPKGTTFADYMAISKLSDGKSALFASCIYLKGQRVPVTPELLQKPIATGDTLIFCEETLRLQVPREWQGYATRPDTTAAIAAIATGPTMNEKMPAHLLRRLAGRHAELR